MYILLTKMFIVNVTVATWEKLQSTTYMQSDATHVAIAACPVLELRGHCCRGISWKTWPLNVPSQTVLICSATEYVRRVGEELSVRWEFILRVCVCVCVF